MTSFRCEQVAALRRDKTRFAARHADARGGCCLHSAGQPTAVACPRRPSASLVSSDECRRQLRAEHTRADLGKGSVTARGCVITERRESAVVGGAELLDRYVLGRFEYTVPYVLWGLDARSDRRDYSDEDPLIRLQVFAYDFQDVLAVPLTSKRDVEISRLQAKQAGQQLCIVDVGAVRRIKIISRAGVDTDAPALLWREPRQREVVQVNEAVEKISGRVDLHGQPSFGEVDLNLVRTLFQAAPNLGFMLAQEIVNELLA